MHFGTPGWGHDVFYDLTVTHGKREIAVLDTPSHDRSVTLRRQGRPAEGFERLSPCTVSVSACNPRVVECAWFLPEVFTFKEFCHDAVGADQ